MKSNVKSSVDLSEVPNQTKFKAREVHPLCWWELAATLFVHLTITTYLQSNTASPLKRFFQQYILNKVITKNVVRTIRQQVNKMWIKWLLHLFITSSIKDDADSVNPKNPNCTHEFNQRKISDTCCNDKNNHEGIYQ